ncbi:MAG: archease [Candidatus Eisenbacteria bacterium]|nr:archease [Candidatus Eisenbacteria bacterium]
MDTKKGARGYRRPGAGELHPEDLEEVRFEGEGVGVPGAAAGRGPELLQPPQRRPRYELLDHTADLGMRVEASTLEGLFEEAGLALFDLVTDLSRVRPTGRFEFSLRAENLEGLFVQWLRELVYRFFGEKTAFCRLEVSGLTEESLTAACWGERVDPARHAFRMEIKAVTYHDLRVARSADGWTAEVIFDI